jgi:dUTP pyrophosphatase
MSSYEHPKIEVSITAEEGATLPTYSTEGASGADVRAFIKEEISLLPGQTKVIPTGLRFAIPHGYEIQVRPRSGLAVKNGITVLNTPGTIDADYRGELQIILTNHGNVPFTIVPDMRIAQIVLCPVIQALFVQTADLTETKRGCCGFGHTGTH